jgi:epoxyqueuosine reductase
MATCHAVKANSIPWAFAIAALRSGCLSIVVADRNRTLVAAAREQGFTLVGFAKAGRLEEREEFFHRWLGDGRHGTMAYLAREPERRLDPRRLTPQFRSVVSLGYPYHSPAPPRIDWRKELRGRIAAYALGPDYHEVVLKRARAVASALLDLHPGALARVYVDTGPVFEREWAVEARLGWFGKNTMTLNADEGSYFFLAEIFTDVELEPSRPAYREHCGTCTRCLDLCPTGALGERYLMEPRLCISYLTIENRGPIPPELRSEMGNWIFGCDICQEVCPWNQPFPQRIASDLLPYMPGLMALDDDGFNRRFGKSAVKRAKRRGLLRNTAVALGNSGNREAIGVLARTLGHEPEPLVRAHAAWALGRLGGAGARRALEAARRREAEAEVAGEVEAALAHL